MANFREDEDIINSSERTLERFQRIKLPTLQNSPKLNPEVTKSRIENFTCPACKETLKEVVSVNGRVRGWCGNTHTYVSKEM